MAGVLTRPIPAIATDAPRALIYFHGTGGRLWASLDLFVGLVPCPITGYLSIPARVEFTARFMLELLATMLTLAIMTLVTMTLRAGWQLARHVGNLETTYPHHGWLVASMIGVGIMAVIALGLPAPTNLAVRFELKKPVPNGARVSSLAGPGKVLVSSAVKELVTGSPVRFADRCEHTLEGVRGEERVWVVED